MTLRSKGQRELTKFERRRLKLKARLRSGLAEEAVIEDGPHRSRFLCETAAEAYRAVSLWIKEPGTMAWLDRELRPGDRFLDIGANMGIYSIAAAHRVGPEGRVFSVEPHKPNLLSLMRNVEANGFGDRIDILGFPVTDAPRVERFNYLSLVASSSGSQLGSALGAAPGESFSPVGSELCLATSIDALIEGGTIRAPHLVKIDVDGIELSILRGMAGLLSSAARPRSVQVELNIGEQEAIRSFMEAAGYTLAERHMTRAGEARRQEGAPLSKIAHNAVFIVAD